MSDVPARRGRADLLTRRIVASGPLLVLIGLLIVIAVVTPSFYGEANIANVLRQVGILGIVAVGQTLVILGGGVDLSVGAVMSVALVTAAVVTQGKDANVPLAVVGDVRARARHRDRERAAGDMAPGAAVRGHARHAPPRPGRDRSPGHGEP